MSTNAHCDENDSSSAPIPLPKEFPTLLNDLVLRAAVGQPLPPPPQGRTPVWIMRQAGRYLPEFREIRQKYSFFELCSTPRLACEVSLQPLQRFDLDAAIIFSDILTVPQALGMQVDMVPGVGPKLPQPLRTHEDVDRLLQMDPEQRARLREQHLVPTYQAVTLLRHSLQGRVPLIGFTGAPWTLLAYMIEGGGDKSGTLSQAKRWLYSHSDDCHRVLGFLAEVVADHLVYQAKAGAQLLQVFESHAGVLGPDTFRTWALPYLQLVAQLVRKGLGQAPSWDPAACPDWNSSSAYVPLILFAKGAHYDLEQLGKAGYDVVSLDWTVPRREARTRLPGVSLQGNLDPCALYSNSEDIRAEVERMLQEFGASRLIANLGHGIYPDMEPQAVATMVDAVHQISQRMMEKTSPD